MMVGGTAVASVKEEVGPDLGSPKAVGWPPKLEVKWG